MSIQAKLTLAVEPMGRPDVWALVLALREELNVRYDGSPGEDPEPDDVYLTEVGPADVVPPNGAFVVARIGRMAVGCGAVRSTDSPGTGEIKRMYVRPDVRGRGISRLLLTRLEEEAAALGYRRLRLETGTEQPEAMALYESAGWEPIEKYGKWLGSAMSRCYGKIL